MFRQFGVGSFILWIALIVTPSYQTDPKFLEDLNEEEFEELFNLPKITDPDVYKKRNDALMQNENSIKETNKEFLAGDIDWFDGLNSFDDLTEEEFVAEKTGLKGNYTN